MSLEHFVYDKEFLLSKYKIDFELPKDFVKLQYATLKEPAPPVNSMTEKQLSSYKYVVDLPPDHMNQKHYGHKGRMFKNKSTKIDGNKVFNRKNDDKNQSWRKEKKNEEPKKKPEPSIRVENKEKTKMAWNVVETKAWKPLQEIVESEEKLRSKNEDISVPVTSIENETLNQPVNESYTRFIKYLQGLGLQEFKHLLSTPTTLIPPVNFEIEDLQDYSTFKLEYSDIEEKQWYYRDPQNNIQGPFNGVEMNRWLVRGYFKPDLMVKKNESDKFYSLGFLCLIGLRNCFTGIPLVNFFEELLDSNIFKVMMLRFISHIYKEPEVNEKEQLENEKKVTAESTTSNTKKTTVSNTPKKNKLEKPDNKINQNTLKKVATKETRKINPSEENKKVPSLYEIQQEELRRKELEKNTKVVRNEPKKNTKIISAWNNVSTPKEKLSLKQIQDEELSKKSMEPKVTTPGPITKPLNAWGRPPTIKQSISLIQIQQEELQKSQSEEKVTNDEDFWNYPE